MPDLAMQVAGNTAIPAVNGTAEYTSLRLRGREGIHNITFQGQTLSPNRDLMPSQVRPHTLPGAGTAPVTLTRPSCLR